MHITAIEANNKKLNRINTSSVRKQNLHSNNTKNQQFEGIAQGYTQSEIAFGTKNKKTISDYLLYNKVQKNYTSEARGTYNKAVAIAKSINSPELELWHLYYASLLEIKKFINELNSGETLYDAEGRYKTPFRLNLIVTPNCEIFADKENREKVLNVLNKHLNIMKKYAIDQKAKNPKINIGTIKPSKNTINELAQSWDALANAQGSNIFCDDYFFVAIYNAENKALLNEVNSFVLDLKKELMTDNSIHKQKGHLQFFDEKADTIWKNISLGNNVAILNDAKNPESYKHLVSSFVNLINKPGQEYKNISADKLQIVVLNELSDCPTLLQMANDSMLKKANKDKTIVYVANLGNMLVNSGGKVDLNFLNMLEKSFGNKKDSPNIKFAFVMPPETYYTNTQVHAAMRTALSSFAIQTLPTLNASDTKKYLLEESGTRFIEDKLKKEFSPETIEKAVDLSNAMQGNYPNKALELLGAAAKYFVDSNELTPEMLEQYVLETADLSEVSGKNEEVTTIFDTGKKLNDIVGTPMTKSQAESLIKQIKAGGFKTKGYCIQHASGTAEGGGRRHVAESIAGEAQIPMIIIDAQEFALKDIDAVSQNTNLLEMKIKKIISNAKAQAETNPNNTAMIFIKNFDNFASDPLYGVSSIYERKAFSQLLAEMDSVRRNDKVNLLVMGSMNRPELLDANIVKPYKFLNSIVVYQPHNAEERREVIEYYIDKMNLQIDAKDEGELDKIVQNIAESTSYFSVVDLIYLLETAQLVAIEEGEDKIKSSDFTEAFLRTVSGVANTAYVDESEKKIVTSHEAGHALNLQIMKEVAQNRKIPWYLPDNVDFITLDPRGEFGGAMFHKPNRENRQTNFETIMSNLVCSYGGHSAEKNIYNMSGTWGITSDMEHVYSGAESAVTIMGMGPKTGVRHIPRGYLGDVSVTDDFKKVIEQDRMLFEDAALQISDLIINKYKDFILQFTEKYYSKVATGECIIPGEQFIKELNEWRENQPPETQKELEYLEDKIEQILDKTKKGEKF